MNRKTDPEGSDFSSQRKNHECIQQEVIHGNGKPGLVENISLVNRALYGDPKNKIKGMIEKQQDIITFIQPLKLILNRWVLYPLCILSFSACLKVLGADLVVQIIKAFMK